MTVVRASCGTCGDVEFSLEGLIILHAPDQGDRFSFLCPSCGEGCSKPLLPHLRTLLDRYPVRRVELPPREMIAAAVTELTAETVEAELAALEQPGWEKHLLG